jgi:N-carbamoylputrescine amidase
VLNYRKLHLFDREQEAFTPGADLPIVDTEYGVLGICVCYDLRFVEVLRSLSLRGADVVLAPAAWTGGFDSSVPATGMTRQAEAVVVQANLDQVAVVVVSQVGVHLAHRVNTLGGSLAVDAFGDVVIGPLSRTEADSATVEIDIAKGRQARVRSHRIRPRDDRRTDIYAVSYKEEAL